MDFDGHNFNAIFRISSGFECMSQCGYDKLVGIPNMVCHRMLRLMMIVIAVLGGGIFVIFFSNSAMHNERLYKQGDPVPDAERRQERLGNESDDRRVDMTAFAGMPEAYSEFTSEYIDSVTSAIKSDPIMRRRFYHSQREREGMNNPKQYPDDANPIYDRNAVVPLAILPRPDSVRTWSASPKALSLGWRVENTAVGNRGFVYGRTLIFEPGELSKNPNSLPASPFETKIPSWHLYVMGHRPGFFLSLGKMVVTQNYDRHGIHKEEAADLHLGEKDGAKLLGEVVTVPVCVQNNRLRWASIQKGSIVRKFLAYSLLDGNGAKRARRFQESINGPISPYVRPLTCERHQPKIRQHDELLLPSPREWPPASWQHANVDGDAHEEWCLDDWFPAQKDACWVIREAEDSKPLQESFLLMPASETSERPVFFIALFAETAPKQLISELAKLYKVSPDAALNSPETMQRLNSLYEKVRDFPLAK